MEKNLEVIEGDDDPSPIYKVLKLGGFAVGFTKQSIKGGVVFAAELGDAFMYSSGQARYANELEAKEPIDRADRELKTAKRAFTKKRPDPVLGIFASRYVMSALRKLKKTDPEAVVEKVPDVIELIQTMPDTEECAQVAEQLTAECLSPIVDELNHNVRLFPTQREPSD